MNFWERVECCIEERNLTKKELSVKAGFSPSNISKGIKKGNIPSADTAVKIAHFLGTTVEFLVTGTDPEESESEKTDLDTLRPFSHLTGSLDALPPERRQVIETMIQDLSETYGTKD